LRCRKAKWRLCDRSGLRSLLYSDPHRRDGDGDAALPIAAQFAQHIA